MSDQKIDLRSDTVTVPCEGMRQAMATAAVGDDVFGEDPTVTALEKKVAAMLGMEAAVYMPSGTMCNQIALNLWTSPGDEVLVGHLAHIRHFEGGAAAAIAGVQLVELPGDGTFTQEDVISHVQPATYGRPRTTLTCVENTHNVGGGLVWPLEMLRDVVNASKSHGLFVHLDGARLWHAHAKTGLPLAKLCYGFDSVSVCLSKGLGAPVGSVLCGDHKPMAQARTLRRRFGGAMRQAGIVAAAGLFALEHNLPNLQTTHEAALSLWRAAGGESLGPPPQTNIVMLHHPQAPAIVAELEKRKIYAWAFPSGIRLVTHLQISKDQCEQAGAALADVAAQL